MAICVWIAAQAGLASPAAAQDFRIVVLPDTQEYAADYPAIYQAQTQWIADRAALDNIRFVSHLGDIVDEAGTPSQWDIARTAMDVLDIAEVPYGTCVGNHDVLYPGSFFDPDGTAYRARFGPQFYADADWYRGHSPSELSNYQVIEVQGQEYLFLHLMVETPAAELSWAQEVLNCHRDKPTWISTHRYLFDWGPAGQGRYDGFNYYFEPPYVPDGIRADDFWRNFVAQNQQVYLVHCGHNAGEYRQTSTNNFGHPVHEVLADYQRFYGNGGNGWLRVMHVRPELDRIDVETYSPSLDEYRSGSASQFSLSVDWEAITTERPILRFQQGAHGYNQTVDSWVGEGDGDASHGTASEIVVDNDTSNSPFGEDPAHGLLRFEGLFQGVVTEGDPAPTRIPQDATIARATLTLNLTDDVDLGNPEIYLYPMTVAWTETSTWNSLGGGVQPGSNAQGQPTGFFLGDNDPSLDFTRSIDVTQAVLDWQGGTPNWGFGIVAEDLAFNDDGIGIRSSEDANSALRPTLEVEFHYTALNAPPTVTQLLTPSASTVHPGEEVDFVIAAEDPHATDPLTFRIDGVDVGFAVGSGSITHSMLFSRVGSYSFTATVADDELEIPAGTVTIQVVPRLDPGPVLPTHW